MDNRDAGVFVLICTLDVKEARNIFRTRLWKRLVSAETLCSSVWSSRIPHSKSRTCKFVKSGRLKDGLRKRGVKIVEIDEYVTSQRGSKCLGTIPKKTKFWQVKRCWRLFSQRHSTGRFTHDDSQQRRKTICFPSSCEWKTCLRIGNWLIHHCFDAQESK